MPSAEDIFQLADQFGRPGVTVQTDGTGGLRCPENESKSALWLLISEGKDAEAAMAAVEQLIQKKFNEEQCVGCKEKA